MEGAIAVSTKSGGLRFGPYELDRNAGELRKHGIKLKISGQPLDVLGMLLEQPGELVPRDDIRRRLWPANTFVDFDHSLNAAVNKLREALGDSAENPTYIETVPRRGYRFIGQVEPFLEATGASAAPVPSPPQPHWPSTILIIVLAAAVAVAILVAARILWPRPAIESVAVLPFAVQDPQLEYLGDGIAATLTDNLSQVPGLHVLSRNSATQFRDTKISTRELAQRLHVQGLVTGSIQRRADGALRVSVELVNGEDDRHLWGEEYAVPPMELASAQPQIAQDLFLGLRRRLDSREKQELGRPYTVIADAYDAYLRGQYVVRSRDVRALPEAPKLFDKAARLDPNFALAYWGLQEAYGIMSGMGIMAPREALPLAEAASLRGLQLAPELAESHISAAYQQLNFHHNLPGAIAEAERAIRLNPDLPEAHHARTFFLWANGQFAEAVEEEKIVLQLDPEWPLARRTYVYSLIFAGRWDEAAAAARSLSPDDRLTVDTVMLLDRGRYRDAVAQLQAVDAAKSYAPTDFKTFLLAWGRAELGDPALARQTLRALLEERKKRYVPASRIASVYAVLRDRERTLTWLNTAMDEWDATMFVPPGKFFDSLRDDPDYQAYRRKLFTPR